MTGLSISALGVIGYAAAHEVLYKKGKIGQILQYTATLVLGYPHYKMIHLHGHHKRAATPEDKNTAWANESFYRYLLRSGFQSTLFCFHSEQRRLARTEQGPIFNNMIWFGALYIIFIACIFSIFVWVALGLYVAHVIGAYLLLEAVNYIQHYGLLREPLEARLKKYRAITPGICVSCSPAF